MPNNALCSCLEVISSIDIRVSTLQIVLTGKFASLPSHIRKRYISDTAIHLRAHGVTGVYTIHQEADVSPCRIDTAIHRDTSILMYHHPSVRCAIIGQISRDLRRGLLGRPQGSLVEVGRQSPYGTRLSLLRASAPQAGLRRETVVPERVSL